MTLAIATKSLCAWTCCLVTRSGIRLHTCPETGSPALTQFETTRPCRCRIGGNHTTTEQAGTPSVTTRRIITMPSQLDLMTQLFS